MQIRQLLSDLKEKGIYLQLENGKLISRASSNSITPELREAISKNKEEIVNWLKEHTQQDTIRPAARNQPLVLSCSQERLWFLDQYEENSRAYYIPHLLRLTGNLDTAALRSALRTIIERHEVLRTNFIEEDDVLIQHVTDAGRFVLEEVSNCSRRELPGLVRTQWQRPFNLARDLLFRAILYSINPAEHYLFINMHHIISDGWSMGIIIKEISTLYSAYQAQRPQPYKPLPIQYCDYAVWQKNYLQSEDAKKKLSYWKQQLRGVDPLEMPTSYTRPVMQSFEGDTLAFELEPGLTENLRKLSREHEVTLFMTLQAAFALLLHRYSAQDDFTIGTPIANRNRAELEKLIGFFVNTLVLRQSFKENPTFVELLKQTRATTLQAYENQDIPFEKIVDALSLSRNTSYTPLFQVMFALQNIPETELKLPNLSITTEELPYRNSTFDLTLNMYDQNSKLEGAFIYATELFSRNYITAMLGHFKELLCHIIEDVNIKASDYPLLTDRERHQLLVAYNRTESPRPGAKTIHELFEEQTAKTPGNIALCCEGREYSYADLNSKANRLAHYLRQQGVSPGTLAAIFIEPSLNTIIGILGILKAGGAYVPLNPLDPAGRIEYMLKDTGAILLLSPSQSSSTPDREKRRVVYLDALDTSSYPETNPGLALSSTNLAYVIYTSGSTGQPKGVMVEHGNIFHIAASPDYVQIEEQNTMLNLSNFSFDGSVFDLFAALCNGARLVLLKDMRDLDELERVVRSNKNVIFFITTALFNTLVDHKPAILPLVKTILFGGQQVSVKHVRKALEYNLQLIHVYGPTETTVFAAYYPLHQEKGVYDTASTIPIGRPLPNMKLYVLDGHLNPVAKGIPGELYIQGPGLARGYLNSPELTAEKFIPSPFVPGQRLYRTGDRVRYQEDGNLEFLGRLDAQIKLRGFRIELGEIESALRACPDVNTAVVLAREGKDGNKSITAYLTLKNLALEKTEPCIQLTAPRSQIRQFEALPVPDRSLVDYRKYHQTIGMGGVKNSISIQCTRGCPYNCAYCHKIWPKEHVVRSAEHIFEEVRSLNERGIRRFVIVDDIFNLNIKNSSRFFHLIIRHGLDVEFYFPNGLRGDILTTDYIDLMVEAGVANISMPLETASLRLQKLIEKNLKIDKLKENLDYISKRHPGVVLDLFIMHGFPTETEAEAKATLDFLKSIKWCHFPQFSILKIYPNTDMERLALANGVSGESILHSSQLAYHELPQTLPFDEGFTRMMQTDFLNNYFLAKERLLAVLPHQMARFTEDELMQKYDTYLPIKIHSFDDLLTFTKIKREELQAESFLSEEAIAIPQFYTNPAGRTTSPEPEDEGLKVLLLDLSRFFSGENSMLYDVAEAPLGLMYLMTSLKHSFPGKIQGRVAKSRHDFDSYAELRQLIDEEAPHVIGVRSLTFHRTFLHKTVSRIREWGFKGAIIAGGPYSTSDYTSTLRDKNIDLVVRGEGEETFCELISAIIRKGGRLPEAGVLSTIAGLAFIHPSEREKLPDLEFEIPEGDGLGNQSCNAGTTLVETQLREFLHRSLPEYMLPASFVFLETLPLTPNGKVDKKALEQLEIHKENSWNYAAPRTDTERKLAAVFSEVLQVEQVGLRDDFFSLGGHSLLATQLISRIRSEMNTELPLRTLFENPCVEALSLQLDMHNSGLSSETLAPLPIREEFPLSYAQERLWFLDQYDEQSNAYHVPVLLQLKGNLHKEALKRALQKIVERHEALRTNFTFKGNQIVQQVNNAGRFKLEEFNCTGSDPEELVKKELIRPFALDSDLLFRAILYTINETEHHLFLNMHHIVSDGWSVGILIKEFVSLYTAYKAGENDSLNPLPLQYGDYAAWQKKYLQGKLLEEQLAYWKEQLQDIEPLELPISYPRPARQSYNGRVVHFELDAVLTERLRQLSRTHDVTLFMTLLAGFSLLLHRYSGQDEIAVGTLIANRNRTELEDIIGFFVNTLVLRQDFKNNPGFTQLLQQVKTTTLSAFEHQDTPFSKVVEAVHTQRDISRSPLFQVLFVLQNTPGVDFSLPGLTIESRQLNNATAKFDMSLSLTETGDILQGDLEYATELFSENYIADLIIHFKELLRRIVENTDMKIAALSLLDRKQEQRLLVEYNRTEAAYPREKTLHQLFEEQAAATPERLAVVFHEQQFSYSELNHRANQLAYALLEEGVKPGSLVAICVERSAGMLIGLLAILKAGGAYVAIEPGYPAGRIAYILEDSQALLLLTQEKFSAQLPPAKSKVILLDNLDDGSRQYGNPEVKMSSDSLAYVIYTSGSTGQPKGVMIEHRSSVAFVCWAKQAYTPDQLRYVLASTSYCFDLSVFEMFVPLCTGNTVCLTGSILDLIEYPVSCPLTLINTVPSAIMALYQHGAIPGTVTTLNLAGEKLQQKSVDLLYSLGHIRDVFDLYGPSEDTTYSTRARREAGGCETIGKAISNTKIYILDKYNHLVPQGIPGELCIAGAGLARGYLNRPRLTAEKFIANPFEPDTRLYKTGDFVRYLEDGSLEFLGRMDDQVKLNGFRIELGEIEQQLLGIEGIKESAVVVREDAGGIKKLIAYIIATSEKEVDGSACRQALKEHLPEYMLPAAFIRLDAMPRTANGKLDRKKLRQREVSIAAAAAYIPPRDVMEKRLTCIFSEILQVDRVGIYDNFFELGGHSLLAARLVARIRSELKRELSLKSLFENNTVAALKEQLLAPGADCVSPEIKSIEYQQRKQFENQLTDFDEVTL